MKILLRGPNLWLILVLAFFQHGCTVSPRPINYGSDSCSRCSMMIMDQKFGAEIVTSKGKSFTFDSAECMIKYLKAGKQDFGEYKFIMVTDASKPGTLIHASNAFYLVSENFPSPMGENLSCFESEATRDQYAGNYGGIKLNWLEIMERLK